MNLDEADPLVQLAWLGGLFEGEGSIFRWTRKSRRPGTLEQTYYKTTIAMTDEDSVRRAMRFAGGVGRFGGPYSTANYPRKKPLYSWIVSSQADVLRLIEDIYPFLGLRRQAKAREAMEFIKSKKARSNGTQPPVGESRDLDKVA